ncbi:MAG: GNAT family N-acetyltransferase [Gemmatimonadaceae bacterium]|nr:GNAT family N-acetyltransferase [Gemmatimonadaceae bacterium]
MPAVTIPRELQTARLALRSWQGDDAAELLPILEANWEHLSPWIPARVASPSPLPELRERLVGNAQAFADDREWRFAMLERNGESGRGGRILGELSLFPRSVQGRVPLGESDRAEIGYWIRADATGRGLVSEGVGALVAAARTIARFQHLEIRCDARNAPSVAIPRRLGFTLAETIETSGVLAHERTVALQVWTMPLARGG